MSSSQACIAHKLGFELVDQKPELEWRVVAEPVFGSSSAVVGSVDVSVSAARMMSKGLERTIAERLLEAADAMSADVASPPGSATIIRPTSPFVVMLRQIQLGLETAKCVGHPEFNFWAHRMASLARALGAAVGHT